MDMAGKTMTDQETELGLIDEAKQAVEKWMARWIEVVSLLSLLLQQMLMLTVLSK